MLRRVTMAAVVAVVAATMVAPAALAQDDYSTTQVEYGQDVYSGTEGGAESGAGGSAGASAGAWTKFTAKLSGDNEVGGGDPDGSGTALLRLNPGLGQVCFELSVSDITLPATGAHIHVGTATEAGPVVVGLIPPDAGGTSSGCVSADADLIKAILQNPENYYVNVHTVPLYAAGAIRGQLSK